MQVSIVTGVTGNKGQEKVKVAAIECRSRARTREAAAFLTPAQLAAECAQMAKHAAVSCQSILQDSFADADRDLGMYMICEVQVQKSDQQ